MTDPEYPLLEWVVVDGQLMCQHAGQVQPPGYFAPTSARVRIWAHLLGMVTTELEKQP